VLETHEILKTRIAPCGKRHKPASHMKSDAPVDRPTLMSDDLEGGIHPRGGMPPPLPKRRSAWQTFLLCACGVVALVAVLATGGFLFVKYGTQVIELTDDQRAALHQAADLQEWYEFEVVESCETWTGERLFDGAVELSYVYDDPREEAPYLNASLHYEPKLSDAVANFTLLWQGAKLGVRFSDTETQVEEQHDLFRWGDASRLAFLTSGGVRNGMIFCARKNRRVYLLMTGGAAVEDAEELDAFLRPKLEAASTVAIAGARP
jgi:nitrate reductase NapE component